MIAKKALDLKNVASIVAFMDFTFADVMLRVTDN